MVKEERLKIEKGREVRDGTAERVVAKTQNSKLVEASQGIGGEGTTEAKALKHEANHSALGALHTLPLAVVVTLVERIK